MIYLNQWFVPPTYYVERTISLCLSVFYIYHIERNFKAADDQSDGGLSFIFDSTFIKAGSIVETTCWEYWCQWRKWSRSPRIQTKSSTQVMALYDDLSEAIFRQVLYTIHFLFKRCISFCISLLIILIGSWAQAVTRCQVSRPQCQCPHSSDKMWNHR